MEATLEKKKSIVLPSSFTEIDSDEMMYVEGGKRTTTRHNDIWGILTKILGVGYHTIRIANSIKGIMKAASKNAILKIFTKFGSGVWNVIGWAYDVANTIAAIAMLNTRGYYYINETTIWGIPIGYSVS